MICVLYVGEQEYYLKLFGLNAYSSVLERNVEKQQQSVVVHIVTVWVMFPGVH